VEDRVLKGDLAETPVAAVLQTLAQQSASGCLHLVDPGGDESLVYLRHGAVYFIAMPGPGPQLGNRLVSSGALLPESLAEALEAQGDAMQAWRLGELLVHVGYVDQSVVEAFVFERLLASGATLLDGAAGHWQFVDGEATRDGVASDLPVAELLRQVLERQHTCAGLSELVSGPEAVPALSPGGMIAEDSGLSSDAWAVLSQVDGDRTVRELAMRCGFTVFEATTVIAKLVRDGFLDVRQVSGTFPAAVADSPAASRTDTAELLPERFVEPDAWQAAALLSELSREQVAEQVKEDEEEEQEVTQTEPAVTLADVPAAQHDGDTASLMRELSFLGLDDPPASPPKTPPKAPAAVRPQTLTAQKKRKGLFGR
jgi:hypothetical protein